MQFVGARESRNERKEEKETAEFFLSVVSIFPRPHKLHLGLRRCHLHLRPLHRGRGVCMVAGTREKPLPQVTGRNKFRYISLENSAKY